MNEPATPAPMPPVIDPEGIADAMVTQSAFAGTEAAATLRALIIAAIRAAVHAKEPRTIQIVEGPLFDFEEIAGGVRLWRGPSGDLLAIDIDPRSGPDDKPYSGKR